MVSNIMYKQRVRDGIKFSNSSHTLPMPVKYIEFCKIYDWCEEQFGEFNQTWSTIYGKGGINWTFQNREHLLHFLLTWY